MTTVQVIRTELVDLVIQELNGSIILQRSQEEEDGLSTLTDDVLLLAAAATMPRPHKVTRPLPKGRLLILNRFGHPQLPAVDPNLCS